MIGSVLLTGAAGRLGRVLRPHLASACTRVRISDIAALQPSGAEEAIPCDLRDAEAVRKLVDGMDAVVHLGGSLARNDWALARDVNIDGTFNIYESARLAGVRRIVYASSNHVIGMYPREDQLDLDAPCRPDSLYGVSKAFGEALSRYYWDKYGIESACLRIGSALAEPSDERSLATWQSYPDFAAMAMACLTTPFLGWTPIWGISDNDRRWWDNRQAAYVGYRPRDNAETFAAAVLARTPPLDPGDLAIRYQGGSRSADDYVPEGARPYRRPLKP